MNTQLFRTLIDEVVAAVFSMSDPNAANLAALEGTVLENMGFEGYDVVEDEELLIFLPMGEEGRSATEDEEARFGAGIA